MPTSVYECDSKEEAFELVALGMGGRVVGAYFPRRGTTNKDDIPMDDQDETIRPEDLPDDMPESFPEQRQEDESEEKGSKHEQEQDEDEADDDDDDEPEEGTVINYRVLG